MNLLNDTLQKDTINKPEIEQVVKEKMEFSVLGTYEISKGFKLFSCNPSNYKVDEIEIKFGEFIQCELTTEGWIWFDPETAKTTIDSRMYYFEAFNMKSAVNMVNKFRSGKIKSLFNLKKPTSNNIDFFKKL